MDDPRPRPHRPRRPGFADPSRQGASSRLFDRVGLCAGLLGASGLCLFGPASGFQHYLIVVPPVLALQSHRSLVLRVSVIALTILAYLALNSAGPVWPQPADVTQVLYRVNAVVGLLLLSGMAFAYAGRYKSVQARLLRSVANDVLTGLLNRRSWSERAGNLLVQIRDGKHHRSMSLVIVGVDHLRPINDKHGSSTGDQVLGTVATLLQHGLREGDLLARWDGDQFIALLADIDAKTVRMVGERLRALVQATTVRAPATGEVLSLTASVGVTSLDANEPLDAAITRAESAMTDAKKTGRNRVVVSRG